MSTIFKLASIIMISVMLPSTSFSSSDGFYDCQDPAADLRLNPIKGEVLWFEGAKLISIPGYKNPFEVEGELEITLSPVAHPKDCFTLIQGLSDFNQEKLGTLSQLNLKFNDIEIGAMVQESLVLKFDKLVSKEGAKKARLLLSIVEKDAYKKGARRAFALVTNGKRGLPLYPTDDDRVEFCKALIKSGYKSSGEMAQLKKQKYEQYFNKEMEAFESEENTNERITWYPDTDKADPAMFYGNFGVFVRKSGDVKGGLFGKINNKAWISHSYINVFWIDDKRRGMKLGTKIMSFALEHSKQRGANIVELGTNDWQAPGFYQKMGFRAEVVEPNFLRTTDGKLNNSYLYRKNLY